jgi:hypothetical protein
MNKQQIIAFAVNELIGQGNIDVSDVIFTENYMAHAEGKTHTSLEFVKRFSKILQNSISEIKVIDIQFFIENENQITWQRTLQGVHSKNMMGIPNSNKLIQWREMIVSRFEGDKIAEEWLVSELKGELLLNQKNK